MVFRRGFDIEQGTRTLIVEDVITTGGSVFELIEAARSRGAVIAGVVNLVERNAVPVDFGVPSQALLHLPVESWEPEDCPLCRQNLPLTSHGRSGKK